MCMYRPNNDRLIVDEQINGNGEYTYIAKNSNTIKIGGDQLQNIYI